MGRGHEVRDCARPQCLIKATRYLGWAQYDISDAKLREEPMSHPCAPQDRAMMQPGSCAIHQVGITVEIHTYGLLTIDSDWISIIEQPLVRRLRYEAQTKTAMAETQEVV